MMETKNETLFSDKIEYLYQTLELDEDALIDLFSTSEDRAYERKKTVINNWLKKKINIVKQFHFDKYKISKITVENNQPAFSKKLFMQHTSYEDFCKAVDCYKEYLGRYSNAFDYHYIYFYDIKLKAITYNQIYIIRQSENSIYEYEVEISPSEHYIKDRMDNFKGTLTIDGDYYYFNVQNSYKRAALYFLQGKGFRSDDKIEGIALSLAYHNGLPHAHKHILTQKKLSTQEEKELYLIANESEYIRIEYNLVELYQDDKKRHIEKLHRDIEHLTNYIREAKKLLNHELAEDLYIDLFQHYFFSLYEVSKQVQTNQNYYRHNQRLMTKRFLEIIAKRQGAECNIVYPTYEKELSLFDEHDKSAKEYVELNLDLAQREDNPVRMNRIFIVESRDKMSEYCIEILKQFVEVGINVKLALKSDVERLRLSSYDLIYDIERDENQKQHPRNYAMYRNDIEKKAIFKITQTKSKIKEMHHNFQKIDGVSVDFKTFMEQKEQKVKHNISIQKNETYKKLIGSWYLYFYGISKDDFVLKDMDIRIDNDGTIKYIVDSALVGMDTLPLLDNSNQIHIKFQSRITNRLHTIVIDKNDLDRELFRALVLYNQLGTNKNVTSLAILSRFRLDHEVAQQTLGESQQAILVEEMELEERISKLYIDLKRP